MKDRKEKRRTKSKTERGMRRRAATSTARAASRDITAAASILCKTWCYALSTSRG